VHHLIAIAGLAAGCVLWFLALRWAGAAERPPCGGCGETHGATGPPGPGRACGSGRCPGAGS
jgi:hypothetical protein